MKSKYLTNPIKSDHIRTILCLIVVLVSFGCSKDETPIPEVKNTEKNITSFVFLLTNNPININIVASIDQVNKTVTATMPRGTNINGLLPEIKISNKATIDFDTARNFTNPVTYTVTAEDGSTVVYTVTITAPLTQRQVLQAILDANPMNTLDWDIENTVDLNALSGVVLNNGSIVELSLNTKNISVIPKAIGELQSLEQLFIAGNPLTTLPPEIGQLTNLTYLNLTGNQITVLPSEIGQLEKLENLSLYNNKLTVLPPEIGQLTALTELYLGINQLTELPVEIEQLTNLEILFAETNQFSSIPKEIGQLNNLKHLVFYNNTITSLPIEIGQLVTIETIDFQKNELTAIPTEMGTLTNMTILNLKENKLINVPQSVCDLRTINGGVLTLLTDLGVGCN